MGDRAPGREGCALLAFTHQGERIEKGVREPAESVASPLVIECDVRSEEEAARVFGEVGETFGGGLDLLVHSVAFAAAEDLEGRVANTPRERFWLALDVSGYSLVACARAAEPLMEAPKYGRFRVLVLHGASLRKVVSGARAVLSRKADRRGIYWVRQDRQWIALSEHKGGVVLDSSAGSPGIIRQRRRVAGISEARKTHSKIPLETTDR